MVLFSNMDAFVLYLQEVYSVSNEPHFEFHAKHRYRKNHGVV